MKISDLKINGIKQPIGYFFDHISVSWTVEETESQYADEKYIEISDRADFTKILCKVSGKEVDNGCTVLPLKLPYKNLKKSENQDDTDFVAELKARTRYYVRIFVKGNQGDEVTGKMDS